MYKTTTKINKFTQSGVTPYFWDVNQYSTSCDTSGKRTTNNTFRLRQNNDFFFIFICRYLGDTSITHKS